jgi:hypothetical protein
MPMMPPAIFAADFHFHRHADAAIIIDYRATPF